MALSKDETRHPKAVLIARGFSAHAVERHFAPDLAGRLDDVSVRAFCAQQEWSVIYWLINTPVKRYTQLEIKIQFLAFIYFTIYN